MEFDEGQLHINDLKRSHLSDDNVNDNAAVDHNDVMLAWQVFRLQLALATSSRCGC